MYYQLACGNLIRANHEIRKATTIRDELDPSDPADMIACMEVGNYHADKQQDRHHAHRQLMTGAITTP